MSDLWVAVTAEFRGSTFSHRATGDDIYGRPEDRAVHRYNVLLDEAGGVVRRGLAGWLPSQSPLSVQFDDLSAHEKLREIEKIMQEAAKYSHEATVGRISKVLKR